MVLKNPLDIKAVKNIISTRGHYEIVRGSIRDNIKYCTKQSGRISGPIEIGDPPQQGKRTDLLKMKKLIDEGEPDKVIAEEYFGSFIRYYKGLNKYREIVNLQNPKKFKTEVMVITGPPGSGKSLFASTFKNAFWKTRGDWWDGYNGQEIVVFDEFYSWMPLDRDWETPWLIKSL